MRPMGAGPGDAGARPGRRRLLRRVCVAGVAQAFVVVGLLHAGHDDLLHQEVVYIDPVAHWLRDATFYTPAGVGLLLASTLVARGLVRRWRRPDTGLAAALLWAGLGALAYALASVPATFVHGALFASGHAAGFELVATLEEAIVTLRYSLAVLAGAAMVFGVPWAPSARRSAPATSAPGPATVGARRTGC